MTTPSFLRLFPLQSVVLFPGMELPLVVFEPRYLQLTKECVDSGEPFGVLLLQAGREAGDTDVTPFEVGTTALIQDVQPTGDGRLHVQAVGQRRFRVHTFSRAHPYLSADVDYLPESPADVDESVAQTVRQAVGRYLRAAVSLRGGYVRDVPLPQDAVELSYLTARIFQDHPMTQQRLLEAVDAGARLRQEAGILEAAIEEITRELSRQRPSTRFGRN